MTEACATGQVISVTNQCETSHLIYSRQFFFATHLSRWRCYCYLYLREIQIYVYTTFLFLKAAFISHPLRKLGIQCLHCTAGNSLKSVCNWQCKGHFHHFFRPSANKNVQDTSTELQQQLFIFFKNNLIQEQKSTPAGEIKNPAGK